MSTIIIIPGIWSHHDGARPLQEALSRKGHEVVLVSMPGQVPELPLDAVAIGRSSWVDSIDAVHRVLDALEPGSLPLLIGESTGGLIAQIVASHRATGPLVLVNAPAPSGMQRSLPFLLFSGLKQMFGHSPRRAFREMVFPVARGERHGISPSRITSPVLIVSGEKDRLVPRSASLELYRLYPQADYQRFGACGHRIFQGGGSEKLHQGIADWIEALGEGDNRHDAGMATLSLSRRSSLHHEVPSCPSLPPVMIPARKRERQSRQAAPSRLVRRGSLRNAGKRIIWKIRPFQRAGKA